jgi:hypothetical protein
MPPVQVRAHEKTDARAGLRYGRDEQTARLLQRLWHRRRDRSTRAATAHHNPGLRVEVVNASAIGFAAGEYPV